MLTESWLQSKVGTTIFTRGKDYLSEGLIEDATRKGQTLIAHVQGSRYKPYRVTINFDDKNGIEEADCTCPYGEEWSGWCKHIVAVLLAEIRAERFPEAPAPKAPKKRGDVDSAAIQKDVRRTFKRLERSYDDYESGEDVAELLDEYAKRAYEYLDVGNAESALALLQAFFGVFLEQWADYAQEDEVYFTGFGRTLGAKLLRTPLNHKQREDWLAALVAWKSELDEYGEGDDLEAVCELVKNPQGIAGESRITTTLRLEWLEEQQRWDDALTVARQAQWWSRLALLQIGRQQLELAERTITEHLDTLDATDCVTLVQALPESESVRALRLSKIFMPHVLRPRHVGGYVPYDEVHKLAAKMLELAQKHEDQPACREAREALLLAAPKLALWKEHFAALDPSEHAAVRERLLQMLMGRGGGGHPEQLAILLEEKEWESAWSIASSGYNSVRHALPTAQKLVAHLPLPVQDYGLRIATAIITGNKSGEYALAASWLAVVRTAEIALGKGSEWNQRYTTLLAANARKYKLMPMLEELGRAPEDEAPPVAPVPPKERKPLIFKIN